MNTSRLPSRIFSSAFLMKSCSWPYWRSAQRIFGVVRLVEDEGLGLGQIPETEDPGQHGDGNRTCPPPPSVGRAWVALGGRGSSRVPVRIWGAGAVEPLEASALFQYIDRCHPGIVGEGLTGSAPCHREPSSLLRRPIGDVRDASPRLRELLVSCDVVAAEDTRRLRRLAAALDVDVAGTVIAYHEHSEGVRTARLVDRLLAGDDVLLVTDAGMPSVSDPGYRLVAAAVAAGVAVTAAPGPSALLVALALSGLPSRPLQL